MNILQLGVLVVLVAGMEAQEDRKCFICASSILESNWAITGFSKIPDDMVFTDLCNNPEPNGLTTCTMTSSCVEVVVHVGDIVAYARGCSEAFYGGDDEVDIPAVSTTQLSVCNTVASSGGNISSSHDTVIFCRPADNQPTYKCNQNLLSDEKPSNDLSCKELTTQKCTYCSRLDGRGSCKHNNKGECTGVYCTKTLGSYGDMDLEIRGCALNPLQATYTYSDLPLRLSVPGHSIEEPLQISTYFCNKEAYCNKANQIYSLVPLCLAVVVGCLTHFI